MSKTCVECGAKCCRYFCFEIDKPESYSAFEDIRWFLCHEGISIHVDEGDWYIEIANRCKMLCDDNRCLIYDDRPLICRKYDPDNCDFSEGDYQYEAEFHTPEALDQYARRTLGEASYERAKAEAQAKKKKRIDKAPQALEIKQKPEHGKGIR